MPFSYTLFCNKMYHFINSAYHKVAAAAAKSLQSCPNLCDPIDGSPPGPTVPGILQARTLEWVAISFSTIKLLSIKYLVLSHLILTTAIRSVTINTFIL